MALTTSHGAGRRQLEFNAARQRLNRIANNGYTLTATVSDLAGNPGAPAKV